MPRYLKYMHLTNFYENKQKFGNIFGSGVPINWCTRWNQGQGVKTYRRFLSRCDPWSFISAIYVELKIRFDIPKIIGLYNQAWRYFLQHCLHVQCQWPRYCTALSVWIYVANTISNFTFVSAHTVLCVSNISY